MKCPKCKSLDVAETMYCNFSTNSEHSESQGYICDECGHDWEAIKQLKDWHGKYD